MPLWGRKGGDANGCIIHSGSINTDIHVPPDKKRQVTINKAIKIKGDYDYEQQFYQQRSS
jgi:hypothetical protein